MNPRKVTISKSTENIKNLNHVEDDKRLLSMEERINNYLKNATKKSTCYLDTLQEAEKLKKSEVLKSNILEERKIPLCNSYNSTGKLNKLLPKEEDIILEENSEETSSTSSKKLPIYFQEIFQLLDRQKTGILTKDNCCMS